MSKRASESTLPASSPPHSKISRNLPTETTLPVPVPECAAISESMCTRAFLDAYLDVKDLVANKPRTDSDAANSYLAWVNFNATKFEQENKDVCSLKPMGNSLRIQFNPRRVPFGLQEQKFDTSRTTGNPWGFQAYCDDPSSTVVFETIDDWTVDKCLAKGFVTKQKNGTLREPFSPIFKDAGVSMKSGKAYPPSARCFVPSSDNRPNIKVFDEHGGEQPYTVLLQENIPKGFCLIVSWVASMQRIWKGFGKFGLRMSVEQIIYSYRSISPGGVDGASNAVECNSNTWLGVSNPFQQSKSLTEQQQQQPPPLPPPNPAYSSYGCDDDKDPSLVAVQ